MKEIGHWINGKHVPGGSGRFADVFNPATGEVQAKVALASKAELDAATADADARWVIIHRPPDPGNPVLPVVRAAGAAAVLSGHNHRYERRTVNGVLCLTVGTGGAPRSDGDEFTPESPDAVVSLAEFGSLRTDYAAGTIRYAFIDAGGKVRDRFRTPVAP